MKKQLLKAPPGHTAADYQGTAYQSGKYGNNKGKVRVWK